jgi:branched-subunit amino acid ABC-type transport system permease component
VSNFLQAIVAILQAGIIDGAVIGLAAAGFSLQFGVTNYVNFAYGEFVTIGAFAAFILDVSFGQPLWVSFVGAGLVAAILSYLIGQWIYVPFFRRRPQVLYVLVVTFSMSIILNSVYLIIWQSNFYELTFFSSNQIYRLGLFSATPTQLFDVGIAVALLVSLYLVLHRTRVGKSMRAVSDNPALATVCGLNTRRIYAYTWLISGFIAGVSGVIQAEVVRAFDVTLGATFLYLIIAAAIVAGIGNPIAAIAGALIIGFGEQIAVYFFGSGAAPAGVFALLVILVLVRPSGLFGAGRTTLQNA